MKKLILAAAVLAATIATTGAAEAEVWPMAKPALRSRENGAATCVRRADDAVVTVNFGDKPFTLPVGDVLPGGGHLVK